MYKTDQFCCLTCGQLLQVNDVTLRRWDVIRVTEVIVWPHRALVVTVVIITSEDQTEFLMAKETLHEAEIERRHAGAVKNQDLVSRSETYGGNPHHDANKSQSKAQSFRSQRKCVKSVTFTKCQPNRINLAHVDVTSPGAVYMTCDRKTCREPIGYNKANGILKFGMP